MIDVSFHVLYIEKEVNLIKDDINTIDHSQTQVFGNAQSENNKNLLIRRWYNHDGLRFTKSAFSAEMPNWLVKYE